MMKESDMVERFGEFDQPSPLRTTYCRKITEMEYEEQTTTETEKALLELIEYLEKDPSAIRKLLCKRKMEDQENGGFLAFLKVRFMQAIHGAKYHGDVPSESECQRKLKELTDGMVQAFNYDQEARGKRFSQRLAAKRVKLALQDENPPPGGVPLPPPVPPPCGCPENVPMPPPPPPPPGPAILHTPLEKKIMTSTPLSLNMKVTGRRPLREIGRQLSATSMQGLHEELLSSNPLRRLKSTKRARSPGGTPLRKAALRRAATMGSADTLASPGLNRSESLTAAFLRVMEEKFRNIRSPSPANNSQLSFQESPGFTP